MADKSLNFLVCCANGAGSSLMAQMALEKVLKKHGIEAATVHHCPISEGKETALQYDVVICAQHFADMFAEAEKKGAKLVALQNVISASEIGTKLTEAGIIK